jgi:hypothetical protein
LERRFLKLLALLSFSEKWHTFLWFKKNRLDLFIVGIDYDDLFRDKAFVQLI